MKKRKNEKVIWFRDEVYNQDFMVVFTPTHKKFCEIVEKEIGFCPEQGEGEENVSGEFHGLNNNHGSLALIWSSDKTGNLIHEVFHSCAFVLRNRDIWLNPETEETYAYYYTYIIRTIKERIKWGN